jgi:hypothetical protein
MDYTDGLTKSRGTEPMNISGCSSHLTWLRFYGALMCPDVFPVLPAFNVLSRVPPSKAPETRVNRAGAFSTVYKLVPFVES